MRAKLKFEVAGIFNDFHLLQWLTGEVKQGTEAQHAHKDRPPPGGPTRNLGILFHIVWGKNGGSGSYFETEMKNIARMFIDSKVSSACIIALSPVVSLSVLG